MIEHGDRIADPPRYYSEPSSILADEEMTIEEQITALKNWRDDINLKLLAAAENMDGGRFVDVNLIAEIDNLLSFLEQKKTSI
ncbi:Uncharacterised protein [Legionella lansingensis]|uniref:Uncharacterized protein n=1 Tax=Legionella lansingensis TaxID=45067 RepID=A0A0W0VJ33_9GAMM|nr:hypothetical protein [Legionella lansingensis]KTD20091.1 hypothetical protein Llan_2020 [Legionella lansingensis]SNV51096.1 Uncharacterised protein [Legionella lansingensis]